MKNQATLVLGVIGLLTFVATAIAGVQGGLIGTTPEPATFLLVAGGLGGLILYQRHKRSKK